MNCVSIRSTILWLLGIVLVGALTVQGSPSSRRPRFIAIPLEDVQLVEVEDVAGSEPKSVANGNGRSNSHAAVVRVPRNVLADTPNNQDAARFERQAGDHHHHEYVDFGAHTGHHGAFGWYADFPVKDPGH